MRLLIELTYGRCRCVECRIDRLEWRWYIDHAAPGAFVVSFAPLPPTCRHRTPLGPLSAGTLGRGWDTAPAA